MVATVVLVGGCGGSSHVSPAAVQPPQSPTRSAPPVPLGTVQDVSASSSFGPGKADVPITVSVLAFRDHVLASDGATPAAPDSHWASAEVKVCRTAPVVFGYPAWVLGDDSGRTAQVSKVLHPGFPEPSFPDDSTAAGCAQGWVTWVTQDVLVATRVSFEQTRDIPGVWRLK